VGLCSLQQDVDVAALAGPSPTIRSEQPRARAELFSARPCHARPHDWHDLAAATLGIANAAWERVVR
jgi:hypothetical protein